MTPAPPSRPIDVATVATASFIESHAPHGGTILEIGCGSGHVAMELTKRGFDVIGIDPDDDAVSRTRQRSVNVVKASWPVIEADRADAVVFTRSLHHEVFEIRDRARVPYLYRYLIDALPETREAASFAQRVLRDEAESAERGGFPLVGIRFVAAPR